MYLAEDKSDADASAKIDSQAPHKALPGGKWRDFPNSQICHHGSACCDIAREWLVAFDFAQRNGSDAASGPRWLREHSKWGPTVWPIHWCEAIDAAVVDCGVHAALSQEIFTARGLTAFRAQLVQRYTPDALASWRATWNDGAASDHWLQDDLIYHEANALLVDGNEIRIWDGSSGSWLSSRHTQGYGSIAALRIGAPGAASSSTYSWGDHRVTANQWVAL